MLHWYRLIFTSKQGNLEDAPMSFVKSTKNTVLTTGCYTSMFKQSFLWLYLVSKVCPCHCPSVTKYPFSNTLGQVSKVCGTVTKGILLWPTQNLLFDFSSETENSRRQRAAIYRMIKKEGQPRILQTAKALGMGDRQSSNVKSHPVLQQVPQTGKFMNKQFEFLYFWRLVS